MLRCSELSEKRRSEVFISSLLEQAVKLDGGHVEVRSDPYGIRVGTIMRSFQNADEIRGALQPAFEDVAIGESRYDHWGIREHVWIAVAHRRADCPG